MLNDVTGERICPRSGAALREESLGRLWSGRRSIHETHDTELRRETVDLQHYFFVARGRETLLRVHGTAQIS